MTCRSLLAGISLSILSLIFPATAARSFASSPQEVCIYVDGNGAYKQVNSRSAIPSQFSAQSRCFAANQNQYLAAPEEMKITGAERREDMSSPIGRIQLRWPRKVESLFGRTPLRAMADAARTVSRALSKSAFPAKLQTLNMNWSVVFLDADLPETQVPANLRNDCHPGWMTPPANIYIVAQRVAGGCGGQVQRGSVADAQLSQVLVHEMGHAVEHVLLDDQFASDRMRAEGFASWFEQYAADSSSILDKQKIAAEFTSLARQSLKDQPSYFQFSGTAFDYARASMYFCLIVDRRGLNTLLDVYKTMSESRLSFFDAIQKRLGWNHKQLEDEVRKYIASRR